ncbi:MAG: response regulator transcription factor [Pseudomonadales bacterium]|nr:response regulator transcription factor [Pseudomonadales bacterium]NRA16946.1 response regulator transcription factor [Oceanospirillaceae bacterium]
MLTILVADNHDLVREGFKSALQELDPQISILGANCIGAVLQQLPANPDIDIVLLDLGLPDTEQFSGLLQIKETAPDTPVAIFSALDDQESVHAALIAGADGYIPKTSSKMVILQAIRLILAGEIYLPSILLQDSQQANSAAATNLPLGRDTATGLTRRQVQVLELIEKGLSNKEIARQIFCTEGTVKAHVTAILKTFGVSSRAKAVIAAKAC